MPAPASSCSSSAGLDRGEGHLCRRVFPGHRLDRRPAALEPRGDRLHPRFYFGGASAAAEQVSATEADVQLFWGEPLDGVRERIERLKALGRQLDRNLPPLEFGLRITTLVRDTTEQAWADAEAEGRRNGQGRGQGLERPSHLGRDRPAAPARPAFARRGARRQSLHDARQVRRRRSPARTWLVGSAEDVANSLRKYEALGITHFVLSDTPYLSEIERQGDQLLPLLRGARPVDMRIADPAAPLQRTATPRTALDINQ